MFRPRHFLDRLKTISRHRVMVSHVIRSWKINEILREKALPHLAFSDTSIELANQQETIEELKARLTRLEEISVERLILASRPRGRPPTGLKRSHA